MKKILTCLLAAVMIFSLAACGGSGGSTLSGGDHTLGSTTDNQNSGDRDAADPSGSPASAEGYDAEYTVYVDGKDEWKPFPGKSGVTFDVSDTGVISVSDNGAKIEFAGKQVGESVITATLEGNESRALVRVREMEAAIPVEFISIDQMIGQNGGTVQIEIKLEPGNIGLMSDEVKITPEGAAGFYMVQFVNWEDFSHTIPIETPSEPITVTVTLEKNGYVFSPASREITIVPGER